MFSAVGLDIVSGNPRLIFFDLPGFYHGINFLVLAIGIYGIGEILWTVETTRGEMVVSRAAVTIRGVVRALADLRHNIRSMLMGSFLGYFVGILPAAGATPGSLMAYGVARTMSKNPETYGKGNVDGVVAPESANNAASTGSMLPMLTLGIPGSPTTAILLGGMVIWGLEPGRCCSSSTRVRLGADREPLCGEPVRAPDQHRLHPGLPDGAPDALTILAPVIFILCVVGGYAPTQDMHDVWLMLIFGVMGYLMRKLDYPLAPAVLAIVLGPLAEASVRQSLIMAHGSSAFSSSARSRRSSWRSPSACSPGPCSSPSGGA